MNLESALSQTLDTHALGVIGIAFLCGVISSMLPCSISMMPVLVGYIGGFSEGQKSEVLEDAILFVVGLALVMTLLGVTAALLGITFGSWVNQWGYYLLGILTLVMGLQLLGVIHLRIPQFIHQMPQAGKSPFGKMLAPLVLGMAFGGTTASCGTPFLATILGFIGRERNIILGGTSLFCYALGQSILILIIGLCTGLLKHLAVMRHVGAILNKISGGVFLLIGLLLIAQGAGILTPLILKLNLPLP